MSAARPDEASRLPALTSLRFFAALHVVLYHFGGPTFARLPRSIGRVFVDSGYSAVSLFFVLSGFILTFTYASAFAERTTDARAFWLARAGRIVPLYLLAELLESPFRQLLAHPDRVSAAVVAKLVHLTMLQSWMPPYFWTGNVPGWSVSVEAFFYLAFPLLLPSPRPRSRRRVLAAMASWWLVGMVLIGTYLWLRRGEGGSDDLFTFVRFAPVMRLPEFMLGVWLGRLFLDDRAHRRDHAGGGCAALVLAVIAVALLASQRLPYLLLHNGLLAPLYAALICSLACGGGRIGRCLSWPPLQKLGEISFAIYLLQNPVFHLLSRATNRSWDASPARLAAFLVTLIATAWLAFHYLEAPARRLLRGWARPLRPLPALAPLMLVVACVGAVSGCATVGALAPTVMTGWRVQASSARSSATLERAADGQALRVRYDLAEGGQLAVQLECVQPLPPGAVELRLRSPPLLQLVIDVVDVAGTVRRFPVARPLAARDPEAWYGASIDAQAARGLHDLRIEAAARISSHVIGTFDIATRGCVGAPAAAEALLDPDGADAVDAPAHDWSAGLGVCVHDVNDDIALDKAREAGFRWLRTDLLWARVESVAHVYDFSAYDRFVAAAERRGMFVLFILDYANLVHSDGPLEAPRSRATVAAFGDFAAAAAAHFRGRPVAFEVWNEPNIAFWKPAPNAADYAALAREAIARIHAVAPSARVSTGGLSGFDFGFLRAMLAHGAADGATAVAVHPYRAGAPESTADDLLLWRQLLSEARVPAEVWNSEVGYSAASSADSSSARERQGRMVARELLTTRALGYALSFHYDLVDDGADATNWEHNFGLLASDGAEKPAYRAAATLAAIARGRELTAILRLRPSSLHAVRFVGRDDSVVAIWSDHGSRLLRLTRPPTIAFDHLGRRANVRQTGSMTTAVIEDAPIYFFFARRTALPVDSHSSANLLTATPHARAIAR